MAKKKEPPKNRPGNKWWSYVTGRRGYNRIRVFRDREGAPIRIEWWDNAGRHREVLRTESGIPIFNAELAIEAAERAARAQAKKREAIAARELLGWKPRYTLAQLLDALHNARESKWRPSYRRDQGRFRAFWLGELGKDTTLDRITPAKVEHVARKAAEANGWSARTEQAYLRYIVDAFYFASKKLKWIAPEQDLAAVEIPKPDNHGVPYTDEEARRLVQASEQVDLRCAGVAAIAATTGRRLNAIRQLRVDQYRREDTPDGPRAVIIFERETDKAKKTSRAYIEDQNVIALIERLLAKPAVKATGLLFPAGDLDSREHAQPMPVSREHLIRLLHEAEKLADVPHIKGRAYHGFKRWFATVVPDPDAGSQQSGTSHGTFMRRYRGERPEEKARASKEAARRIWGT